LVIVDYLQLMTARDPKANREAQVSEFARGLKLLSREQNVCVVAMAQLNREAGDHGRPTMAHLRESGGIEANADVVVLLHRPEIDGMDIDAIVAKNRQGPMGNVPMQLQGAYSRLVPAVNSSQGWSAA
jgi:replicative DNA helicase